MVVGVRVVELPVSQGRMPVAMRVRLSGRLVPVVCVLVVFLVGMGVLVLERRMLVLVVVTLRQV